MINLDAIIQVNFPVDQYYKQEFKKNQIVIHHTISGDVNSVINWWKQTVEHVATPIIIDKNGDIYQLYSSKYWAHHIGLKHQNNLSLNQKSLAIELVNWGSDAAKHNCKDIITYNNYMGFRVFEKYTDEQIESLKNLLIYWGDRYNIPIKYNEDMWDENFDAINGKSGVWTHVSYLGNQKSDCHPQPELIYMLKSL